MLAAAAGLALGLPPFRIELSECEVVPMRSVWTRARLYSTRTGEMIWWRTIRTVAPAVAWSEDGKAVSILDSDWNLITWRNGERVRRATLTPAAEGAGEPPNYAEATRWSPDKRHVLFVVPGAEGSMVVEIGDLCVFSIREQRGRWLDESVAQLGSRWVDSRTVEYVSLVGTSPAGTKRIDVSSQRLR